MHIIARQEITKLVASATALLMLTSVPVLAARIMKLFYFDVRGRAETSRLLLRLSETKFEDVKISAEDWGLKMKDVSPTGQVRAPCGSAPSLSTTKTT